MRNQFGIRIFLCLMITSGFLTGCATSPRQKLFRNMAIGGAVGALIGNQATENRGANTFAWAGASAAVTGVVTAYLDDDFNPSRVKTENQELKKKLAMLQAPKKIDQGKTLFEKALPTEFRSFIQPGEWKRYKVDQWVQDPGNPNIYLRQTEMFEIIPPSTSKQ